MVIPIILRPSDWRTGALQELQALPRDGRAVTSHADPDEAFLQVAEELRALISSPTAGGRDSSGRSVPGSS